ncbi:MAG: PhzF family phenazine biosynthesis protein [Nevskiaceae bacterium]|nr:MAG: PhzF family phenazine biosynthesis protein [Nevskiaceae bacterium]TAM25757.1 MAG: PhzF family phenazine biosynthesis protein [Nevskiaceae bacterium]
MSTLAFHTLDVFTERAYTGNPLAVVLDADGLKDWQMQRIASEFNLSETVFVCQPRTPGALATARIFTPARELPFAGHPTVGSACLLADLGLVPAGASRLVLDEGVGPVAVELRHEAGQPWFAQLTAAVAPETRPWDGDFAELAAVLGLAPEALGSEAEVPRQASCGNPFLIVPVKQPELLAAISFDAQRARALLAGDWAHAIYVYARGYEDGELRARMFAPDLGVAEDPATGSAAVALAGALALEAAQPEADLRWTIHQGVEMGRPSQLYAEASKRGGKVVAVRVGGYAVRITEGRIQVPA